jgi:insulysin
VNYQEVVLTFFNYISVLKCSFPLPAYHFEEMKRMSEIAFRNKEKTQPHSYTISCSELLGTPSPPQWLLNCNLLFREWDAESVKDILNCITPERARVLILAKQHHEIAVGNNVEWKTEKWYGTQYFVKKFEASFFTKVRSLDKLLD